MTDRSQITQGVVAQSVGSVQGKKAVHLKVRKNRNPIPLSVAIDEARWFTALNVHGEGRNKTNCWMNSTSTNQQTNKLNEQICIRNVSSMKGKKKHGGIHPIWRFLFPAPLHLATRCQQHLRLNSRVLEKQQPSPLHRRQKENWRKNLFCCFILNNTEKIRYMVASRSTTKGVIFPLTYLVFCCLQPEN